MIPTAEEKQAYLEKHKDAFIFRCLTPGRDWDYLTYSTLSAIGTHDYVVIKALYEEPQPVNMTDGWIPNPGYCPVGDDGPPIEILMNGGSNPQRKYWGLGSEWSIKAYRFIKEEDA